VVLPEPERPQMASISPWCTASETPRSACTAAGPLPKVCVTDSVRTTSVTSLSFRPRRLAVRPDLDVVGLQREPHPVLQFQFADELAGQLHPAGPVEHRVLLSHLGPLPAGIGRGPAQHLGADPPVPDRDGPLDLA